MRALWNNKLVVKSLGVKNENEAREWFKKTQEAHKNFEQWNKDMEKKMKSLQNKASDYLGCFKDTRGDKRANKSRKQQIFKKKKV